MARGSGSRLWGQFIESEVEFQDVDSRFTEESQVALVGVLLDQVADGGFGKTPLPCDTRNLKPCSGRRDFRIQA